MQQQTRVVVIGGGYAGVTAANRLTADDSVSVTLVNPRDVFVERIRLHQLVAGTDDAVVDFDRVLAPAVGLRVDTVRRIDAASRRVLLTSGAALDYDHLIYAAGSGRAVADVPGGEHAHAIADLRDAEALREALAAAGPETPVVVAGGGPAGIELAAELAEQGRPVALACGGPLGPTLHERTRRGVARRLAALGVDVLDGPGSRVVAVTADGAVLADGRTIGGTVVWTAGFLVPELARASGLSTDAHGRLLTDETLTSVDDERILAAGDAASPSGMPLRMSCQAAGPLGGHAADTVLQRIHGDEPRPFAMGFIGLCLSLGRRNGVFQFEHRDDSPTGARIAGRAGASVKELVCRGTVQQLVLEARHPGATRLPAAFGDRSRARMLASSGATVRTTAPASGGAARP
ncbi:NAD(P)/FAD-dependent oxidoreductase [Leifsonia virtsii]|uniref:FAD-dependent oxidoreductase n=1 Tax=Leifsonia virtsii TaxID=3035915 RepID=A0ABT8J3U2_9MICO|nr:FAD-dependent oxidoreductase [Leifsonia virtsii]MDN4599252.1 FAD-dependent oxidoreductase [Leifsonia virtsii]